MTRRASGGSRLPPETVLAIFRAVHEGPQPPPWNRLATAWHVTPGVVRRIAWGQMRRELFRVVQVGSVWDGAYDVSEDRDGAAVYRVRVGVRR